MKVFFGKDLVGLMLENQKKYLERVEGSDFKETPFTQDMLENYNEEKLTILTFDSIITIGDNSVFKDSELFYIGTVTMNGVCPSTLDAYEFYGRVLGGTLIVDCVTLGGAVVYGAEKDIEVSDEGSIRYKGKIEIRG